MKINEKKLHHLISIISDDRLVNVLNKLEKNHTMKYNEMRDLMALDSNIFSYYLRKLVKSGMLKKDQEYGVYHLTRIGLRTLKLFNDYKQICMEYDLSDCDAEGKIKIIVEGRRL